MKWIGISCWRALLALSLTLGFMEASRGATAPYAADFEGGAGAEWSDATTDGSIPDPLTTFLGRFANGTVTLTLDGLTAGETYLLKFDLLILDSWDNVEPFHVSVDGNLLFNHTFQYTGQTTYPFPPDITGANIGFGSWQDNVFLNVEIPFTAGGAAVQIDFTGTNMQAISDESWGLDNVDVRHASEVPATLVDELTLPEAGTQRSLALDRFYLETSRPLDSGAAADAAHYALTGAGGNGTFGDGDDVNFTFAHNYNGGSRVSFLLDAAPLQPGQYRFQTLSGLLDHAGNPVDPVSRDFEIVNPELGRIENLANETLQEAFLLPVTENPSGSDAYSSYLTGTFKTAGDVDYARFDAEAGDVVSVRVETPNLRPRIDLQNAAGQNQSSVTSDSSGLSLVQNYQISTPGTYYLRLSNTSSSGNYELRLDQTRGPQLEQEGNDSLGAANDLRLEISQSLYQGQVAGVLTATDSAGDFFRLPFLNVGNSVDVSLIVPGGSTLTAVETTLAVYEANGENPAEESATGSLSHTATSDGVYIIALSNASQRSIRGHYFVQVNVNDGVAPSVAGLSLPEQLGQSDELIISFTAEFSEYLDAQSVNDPASYDFRASGSDGQFDTADDDVYTLSSNYSAGLSVTYAINEGPLQPGDYRFTLTTSLKDRVGNGLAQDFVRNFSVIGVDGLVSENKANDSRSLSSSLTPNPTEDAFGMFGFHTSQSAGSNPYFIAGADFNGDGLTDLAAANISSDNVSVFLATGGGYFSSGLHYAAGDGPIALASGDLNGDENTDLIVACHYGHQLAVLLGNGDGTFQAPVIYNVGSNPRSVVAADFNGDGDLDVAVANQSSGNAGVLLGDGTGALAAQVTYATGSTAHGLAAGNVDGDEILDLMVVNASNDNISFLRGIGDGTFDAAQNIDTGDHPRSIALGDLDGDGDLDAAVISANDRMVSVHLGNGDGTFAERSAYPTNMSDPYHIQAGHLDADNVLDVAVANYGSSRISVFLNQGSGALGGVQNFPSASGCIALVIDDFDGDGRNDIATGNYGANSIAVLLGMRLEFLVEDPAGSGLRSGAGRGRIASSGDVDYWSFTGNAGDLFTLAVEVPGAPSSSSLNWRVENPDGSQLTSFNSSSSGWGQSSPATLPMDGTYWILVQFSHSYTGEYHLMATVAEAGIQMESENNNGVNEADAPGLALDAGVQSGTVYGYLSLGDAAGDFYHLGNLSPGTVIRLQAEQPSTAGFGTVFQIVNAAGETAALSGAGVSQFEYTVPAGAFDLYYARILSATTGYSTVGDQYALQFDGSNDYVDTGAWSPGAQWTVEAWVRVSSKPGGRRAIAGGFGSCMDWGIVLESGQFGVAIRPPGGCSQTLASGEEVEIGRWYHVAGVNDGSLAKLYVDGVLKATGAVEPGYVGVTSGTRIGAEACCGNYFPGIIDEVRFWDAPLEQGELTVDPNAGLAGNEAGLVGYYRFDEGAGATTADSSASARTGTLANGPAWIGLSDQAVIDPGLFARYLLDIEVESVLPPEIVSDNLPAEGSQVDSIIDRFSLGFSEDLIASTVNDSAAYELRQAGEDSTFDTGDDTLYFVSSDGYTSGLGNSYSIVDGPLQPGLYRFTVFTSLQNKGGIPLDAPYVRQFEILGVDGFLMENRLNDNPGRATSLSLLPQASHDGTFTEVFSQGVGSNPYFVASGLLNNDSIPDLVSANINSDNVSVLIGRGDGTFEPSVQYAAANGPIALVLEDFNGDLQTDILSVNHYANSFSVLLGNGDGTFMDAVAYGTGSSPRSAVAGDFNGDGNPDIATANQGSHNVGVFIGDGLGAFAAQVVYGAGNGPHGIAAGDFDKDTILDLVVVNSSHDNMSFLKGAGDGTFQAPQNFPAGDTPRSVDAADINGDGNLDAVVVSASDRMVNVLLGQGDGTFADLVNYATGLSDPYHIQVGQLDGDGLPDVAAAHYGSSRVAVFMNQGGGVLGTQVNYPAGSGTIAVAIDDFDMDGLNDMAVANYGSSSITVLRGNETEALEEDPAGGGIWTGSGRGNVSSNSDVDYWSFTGNAGDRLVVAVETREAGSSRSLNWRIEGPDRSLLTSFNSNSNGYGQSSPVTLPHDGTYLVYGQWSHSFTGEYRLRTTLANPPIQLESEANDSIAQADAPGFVLESGAQMASVLGYISLGDSNGDFYLLGNLSSSTQINLQTTLPSTSQLVHTLSIFNASGVEVVSSQPGDPQLSHTVPDGAEATYYARVRADSGAGFFAQYLLDLELADVLPPQITSDTLPEEGSVNDILFDHFNLGFSEDMLASTVLDSANYELISAGPDAIFDTADDVPYTVQSAGYDSGLSSNYGIAGSPLQPGRYRFTATTQLQDRSLNPLEAPYARQFEIAGVEGFVMEDRDNDSATDATSLSLSPQADPDGSLVGSFTGAAGQNPYFIASGDFNEDGLEDLLTANFSSGNISLFLNNGAGSFDGATSHEIGSGPIALDIADLNSDNHLDLVAALHSSHSMGVLLGNGDGTFLPAATFSVGNNPRSVKLVDVNRDGEWDAVTANQASNHASVLLGNGDGTFQSQITYATGSSPYGIIAGDFNEDTFPDLAVTNSNDDTLSYLENNGDGTFKEAVPISGGDSPWSIAAGDLNGDGHLDLINTSANDRRTNVHLGQGNGTFAERASYDNSGSSPYHVIVADLDLDGALDVTTANYSSHRLSVFFGKGDGTLHSRAYYPAGNGPIALASADFNQDGLPDVAAANYGGNNVSVFLGKAGEPLAGDPNGSGIYIGTGRGNVTSQQDADYWSFSADAGDRFLLGVETRQAGGSRSLHWQLYQPDGERLFAYTSRSDGYGAIERVLPVRGTYQLRVSYNHNFFEEYRFRITVASPGYQIESEGNDSQGSADGLALVQGELGRAATVLGFLNQVDTSGDWFSLGTLAQGTSVELSLDYPASSGLSGLLALYSGANEVAASGEGDNQLTHLIAQNDNAVYYARVTAGPGTAGLFSQYILNANLQDVTPPEIVGDTLPSEGSDQIISFDAFGLTFTEDMDPAAVNETANYEARSAGVDGVFYTADDELYHIGSPGYSSGLNASYRITNGPLQPGMYRFEILSQLSDLFGNPLAGDYIRQFRVSGLEGYVFEDRDNDTVFTGTSLSLSPNDLPSGSFRHYANPAVGSNPYDVRVGDLNGDGHDDLVAANYSSSTISVLLGAGDGTFASAVHYSTGSSPIKLDLADLDHDGHLDIGTANYGSSNASVLMGVGDGTFEAGVLYGAGSNPNSVHFADVDKDNELDLITANRGSDNVSVLLGQGDGTFGARTDFTAGAGAARVVSLDADGDGNLDLATVNYNEHTLSILIGDGLGGFAGPVKYGVGSNPYGLAVLDFNGDGVEDLAAANLSSHSISLLAGVGDGTLQPVVDLSSGGSNPYDVIAADLNLDGFPDLAVSNYGSSRIGVLLHDGLDGFQSTVYYPISSNPIAAASGDFNEDGIPDLASANYGSGNIGLLEGAHQQPLNPDGVIGDLLIGQGRGKLYNTSDVDYWTFSALAGQQMAVISENPGNPSSSGLYFRVDMPSGERLVDFTADSLGRGQSNPVTIPATGLYSLRISYNHQYFGEYRFRVVLVDFPYQLEHENNGGIGAATPLAMEVMEDSLRATAVGYSKENGDLDYFNLGEIQAGSTVFLNTRYPALSQITPVVSLYDAGNGYMVEAGSGRPFDGVAEVRIEVTGTYYALIRNNDPVGGLAYSYAMDIQALPTSSVAFPNLQVTIIDPPPGAPLLSGATVQPSFTVENVGSVATEETLWTDRLVLSGDSVLGNADDFSLGIFSHSGALTPGQSYPVSPQVRLPDGISGDFHFIVQTDSGNAVNEFVLEGDNITVTSETTTVQRAPYPDLRIEDLSIQGPDGSNQYTISWNTANRGDGDALGGFNEQILVRNLTTAAILVNQSMAAASDLAVGQTIPGGAVVTALDSGLYGVYVTTDSQDAFFEYDASGHASAEQNTFEEGFQIIEFFDVATSANPAEGGITSGDGSFAVGSEVVVHAEADTSSAPYRFSHWTEQGVFQSDQADYGFILESDRQLVANFVLPLYSVTGVNLPQGAGTILGLGNYFHGANRVFTARPSPGYNFVQWEEDGQFLGGDLELALTVERSIVLTARYEEANPTHDVTVATHPPGLSPVTGAGAYNNGESALISAPAEVVDGDTVYTFERFLLNGTVYGTSASFNKTFSTVDPSAMDFIAEYRSASLKPVVILVKGNLTDALGNPLDLIPATDAYRLRIQFDRTMDTSVEPVVIITSQEASASPVVNAGGQWTATIQSNDTYITPAILIEPGMDGAQQVEVSDGRDLEELVMDPATVYAFNVDATAPPALTPVQSDAATSAATISWNDYTPPSDISGYRIYRETTGFNDVSALTQAGFVQAPAASFTLAGLQIDVDYFVAVVPVDTSGNAIENVTTLNILLESQVPPPVTLNITPVGIDRVELDWSGYDADSVVGLTGFKLFYEEQDFNSVDGLAEKAVFDASTFEAEIMHLDRSKTYFFAVAGYNDKDQFDPNVDTASWTDPLASPIVNDTVLGDGGLRDITIHQDLIVQGGASLTIRPGVVLRFASGVKADVVDGALIAQGTALDPVIFTSAQDRPEGSPARGDWAGIFLRSASQGSTLNHTHILYGHGLKLEGVSPQANALTLLHNAASGLELSQSAALATAEALIQFNEIGVAQLDASQIAIDGSVIRNNDVNASASGSGAFNAGQNWWGALTESAIQATVAGPVDFTNFLSFEPLLTPAVDTPDGDHEAGSRLVPLRLACRTATDMRISEDSLFNGSFFAPFEPMTEFLLSEGGGVKTLYVQFRSSTGRTSEPLSLELNYITDGPVIVSLNLEEGQVLNRPFRFHAEAAAPLGMRDMELLIDGESIAFLPGGQLNHIIDVREFEGGAHRIRIAATDQSGNLSAREFNAFFDPNPPPAPAITAPSEDGLVNQGPVTIGGTAEPFIGLRLLRNGQLIASGVANQSSQFTFNSVGLVEGANRFVTVAHDSIGSASSNVRQMTLDSGAPAAVILNEPLYQAGLGLELTWRYQATGERAERFRVLWDRDPFASVGEAAEQSILLTDLSYVVKGLADGIWHFGVVGIDSAGNVSPVSPLVSFEYDGSAPRVSIAFDKGSPVGTGPVVVTLTSDEALSTKPSLTLTPSGGVPVLLHLTEGQINTYTGTYGINLLTPSGPLGMRVVATDLLGNRFSGKPQGPDLIIDTLAPSGVITTTPAAPVQVAEPTTITVDLILSQPAKPGSTPSLSFVPPIGEPVGVDLTGENVEWSGDLNLDPEMGTGIGEFRLSALDSVDNEGNEITEGEELEIYTGALPPSPAAPPALAAGPLSGGRIQVQWIPVEKAETYSVYRRAGASAETPDFLVADGVTGDRATDQTPSDGVYTYAVTASRLGAESGPSPLATAVSDRSPPSAPVDVQARLVARGVEISWTPTFEAEAAVAFRVYRNGEAIRTVASSAPIIDSPPRGEIEYTVAALDSIGNESLSEPALISMLVGAVSDLQALAAHGQPPQLNWVSQDATAVGFNVYRNGILQNAEILAANTYSDPLPLNEDATQYAVTAVNANGEESSARTVDVYQIGLNMKVNAPLDGVNNPLVTGYFDHYQLSILNRTEEERFLVKNVEYRRLVNGGDPLSLTRLLDGFIDGGETLVREIAFPGASVVAPQRMRVRVEQQTDIGGSSVIYQRSFDSVDVLQPGVTLHVVANQPPLAGGLASFKVRAFNRSYVPIELLFARQNGGAPGDFYVAVENAQGQEVDRTEFKGVPEGSLGLPDGSVFQRIEPRSHLDFTIPDVLVPEALADIGFARFKVVAQAIHYQLGSSTHLASGPLTGRVETSLALTEYYGAAEADRSFYSDDTPVVITGQAIDRASGNPLPNVPLKVGFAARGFKWFEDVETDDNGNFEHVYQTPAGFGGRINIWAAHPLVFDELNQAEIEVYKIYAQPSRGEIRMSKNDVLRFSIDLYNPGDVTLTDFTAAFEAYQLDGENRIPVAEMSGVGLWQEGLVVGPGRKTKIELEMSATLDAPDDAMIEFRIQSSEGATAVFSAEVRLLEAIPILDVETPSIGYLEVSLDRGDFLSGQMVIENNGFRDLEGVEVIPPSADWISVNLPTNAEGRILLPDIKVGEAIEVLVVFSPPEDLPLDFYSDALIVRGSNAQTDFEAGIYALVTSDQSGAVQFYVENILGQPVPNAEVRMRSGLLQQELDPVKTDSEGLVTLTGVPEGDWFWRVSAPGHLGNVGVVEVRANQTVRVETRLSKNLVTINFEVVPVPYTDRYEITIEQVFETHVPAPVLVLDPAFKEFKAVQSGFTANFLVRAKNEGLIEMTDVVITGQEIQGGRLEPLIDFIPRLLPQQVVEVPFRFSYLEGGQSQQSQQVRQGLAGNIGNCLVGAAPFGGIANPDVFRGLAAIFGAQYRCISDQSRVDLARALALTYALGQIAASIGSAAEFIVAYVGQALGCIVGEILAYLGFGGPSGSGGPGPRTGGAYNVGAFACFTADTWVTMADGSYRRIADISEGESVSTGRGSASRAAVSQALEFDIKETLEIEIANPLQASKPIVIHATEEHLFWVDGKGWVAASNLEPGNWLTHESGELAAVRAIREGPVPEKVYTLLLTGDNAFYANGVLVHEACGFQADYIYSMEKEAAE